MTVLGRTYKAEAWRDESHAGERHVVLRWAAAMKLNRFTCHVAGGGSEYVYIEDLKIRFAGHENTTCQYEVPDVNVVGRRSLTAEEHEHIVACIRYPKLCRKTAFAKHVGLTVPKLKKFLTAACYEDVCENPLQYPNTMTQYVRVEEALKVLDEAGVKQRIPVGQERWTEEDYAGPRGPRNADSKGWNETTLIAPVIVNQGRRPATKASTELSDEDALGRYRRRYIVTMPGDLLLTPGDYRSWVYELVKRIQACADGKFDVRELLRRGMSTVNETMAVERISGIQARRLRDDANTVNIPMDVENSPVRARKFEKGDNPFEPLVVQPTKREKKWVERMSKRLAQGEMD